MAARHARRFALRPSAASNNAIGAQPRNLVLVEAQKLQANGTPTFFVGLADGNSSQIKGTRIVGAVPYQTFKEAIDRLLSTQK